jgi:hypothetical protein
LEKWLVVIDYGGEVDVKECDTEEEACDYFKEWGTSAASKYICKILKSKHSQEG